MKKFLLSIAIVAFSASSVFAQENSAEKLRWKGIMNNSFWSNWEIGIAGGINGTSWEDLKTGESKTGDMGWQAELSVTKWYNPIVGSRLSFIGGELNKKNDGPNSNWFMLSTDAVINLSNCIGGY